MFLAIRVSLQLKGAAYSAQTRCARATLDDADDGLALDVVELGRLARRLAVQEAVRAALVEVQYPVPDDLKPDAAIFAASVRAAPS